MHDEITGLMVEAKIETTGFTNQDIFITRIIIKYMMTYIYGSPCKLEHQHYQKRCAIDKI